MPCNLISELNKLRKQSPEAIESASTRSAFNEYMHVDRPIDMAMRSLINDVNRHQSKCLILVCGSAGDGKSHMISYLKHHDDILKDYSPYNDATESLEPTKTSMETLAEKLRPFDDDHCDDDGREKMILAVNLGALNNFLTSDWGKKYSRLGEYVDKSDILTGNKICSGYVAGSPFQHVSFADYHPYSLTENGIKTDFLLSLMAKVFGDAPDNPFRKAAQHCSVCDKSYTCPVKANYEFMGLVACQRYLAQRIVKAVITRKVMVTTRDLLNEMYDAIVSPKFSLQRLTPTFSKADDPSEYMKQTTPMLIYDQDGVSRLASALHSLAVSEVRTNEDDRKAIAFNSLEDVVPRLKDVTKDTPFAPLSALSIEKQIKALNEFENRGLTFDFIRRLEAMKAASAGDSSQAGAPSDTYSRYVRFLYAQSTGLAREIGNLSQLVRKGLLAVNGNFGPDKICIDRNNRKYWILKDVGRLQPSDRKMQSASPGVVVDQFVATLRTKVKARNSGNEATLAIDYDLFRLFEMIEGGYVPTAHDRNRHPDLIRAIDALTATSKLDSDDTVKILLKGSDAKSYICFERTALELRLTSEPIHG